MAIEKQSYNVRIAVESWDKLRWTKIMTKSKSYSDVIILLEKNLQGSTLKQKELVSYYLAFRKNFTRKFKTIMINKTARKTLERVKLLSNDASFTLSDAIMLLHLCNSI